MEYTAAHVDEFHLHAQLVDALLGQSKHIGIVFLEHFHMELLAAGMDMDTDQLDIGQLCEVIGKELILINTELTGSTVIGVHGEIGVDPDTNAQLDTLFTCQLVDEFQLMQAVGDKNIVTANGTGYLEFTRELLLALKADTQEKIEAFYDFSKNGLVR